MKITYSIQVCNESRELFSLANFILKVKDDEDNLNIVVDSLHVTDKVRMVLEYFKDRVTVYERPFDSFYKNSQFHKEIATGDYVFSMDADEMPQEVLIKNLKKMIEDSNPDSIAVPRINIHPGATAEFLKNSGFHANEVGWINWPDYQVRIYRNSPDVNWSDELHTKLVAQRQIAINDRPEYAIWHIKSIEKQESRWVPDGKGDYTISGPKGSLYDILM